MSIRTNANIKDHLREKGIELQVVPEPASSGPADPLKFWTAHRTKRCLVDLTVFHEGQLTTNGTRWKGPFRGRPQMVAEMAPAIYDHLVPLAESSIAQHLGGFRAWWRLFDAIEDEIPDSPVISSTAHLTDLHRQRAFDQGMDRLIFGNFLLLVNKTRAGLGLRPLLWQRPEPRGGTRHLPPQWQTDLIRHELKHRWFATLDRWDLAVELLRTGAAVASPMHEPIAYVEQSRLLQGYQRLNSALERSGDARPETVEELFGDESKDYFYKKLKFTLAEILRGRYPGNEDVRAAFHLCLATTGWNPAVLLALDVNESFIEPHPKDLTRYILRGVKERGGGTEQVTEGLFKTRGGAGFVIQKLIAQTAPLRKQLQQELEKCREQLGLAGSPELADRILSLEQGVRSVWLFTSRYSIHWLTDQSYPGKHFLSNVIASINARQATDRQLSPITASDLRDAYAARVYHASGGSILAVMKALNHKRLSSTRDYLDNTLLQEEHRKLYATFSSALWEEIRVHQRVDPTILAMWSRHGNVPEESRQRLDAYRNIMRSRVGVGCKNPMYPPTRIAPEFQPNGRAMCFVQRCLLCLEHAVIFPDSLEGISKRFAELRYLRANMGSTAYTQSSFGEEMMNVELALLGFDSNTVKTTVADWESRIASGAHRVVEFDGAQA